MRMMLRLATYVVLAAFPIAYAHAFNDDFARIPEVQGAALSPTGEYLAVAKEEEGQRLVAVFKYPAMELIHVIDLKGKYDVGRFWWANDERILVLVNFELGNQEEELTRGELYAVNADGSKGKYLFGIGARHNQKTNSRVQRVKREAAAATAPHKREPRHSSKSKGLASRAE